MTPLVHLQITLKAPPPTSQETSSAPLLYSCLDLIATSKAPQRHLSLLWDGITWCAVYTDFVRVKLLILDNLGLKRLVQRLVVECLKYSTDWLWNV